RDLDVEEGDFRLPLARLDERAGAGRLTDPFGHLARRGVLEVHVGTLVAGGERQCAGNQNGSMFHVSLPVQLQMCTISAVFGTPPAAPPRAGSVYGPICISEGLGTIPPGRGPCSPSAARCRTATGRGCARPCRGRVRRR